MKSQGLFRLRRGAAALTLLLITLVSLGAGIFDDTSTQPSHPIPPTPTPATQPATQPTPIPPPPIPPTPPQPPANPVVPIAPPIRPAENPKPPQPDSPQAREAITHHDSVIGKARIVYLHAVASADKQEVSDLDLALGAAKRGGNHDEADAIEAVRDNASDDAKSREEEVNTAADPAKVPAADPAKASPSTDDLPKPKSPSATEAIARHEALVGKAHLAFCKAVAAADVLEATDLDRAMRAATRAGDLADADVIQAVRDLAAADAKKQENQSAAAHDLMSDMHGSGALQQGIYVLRNNNRITTKDTFAPPVAFHVVARTNSTNLRLSYACDQIIFNWEGNTHQLRIDGGPANGRNKQGAGYVVPNTWVSIDLVVTRDSLTISVDGQQRYQTRADFSRVNDALSIFPQNGSIIAVKSVEMSVPK